MPPFTSPSTAARCARSTLSLAASSSSRTSSTTTTTNSSQARTALLAATAQQLQQQQPTRSLSTTARRMGGGGGDHGGHESEFDPPTGWLWGVPPGEKPPKEGWEAPMYWGFLLPIGIAAVAYAYKPDTSIQTWALEEARRRLEAEGILPDPDDEKKE